MEWRSGNKLGKIPRSRLRQILEGKIEGTFAEEISSAVWYQTSGKKGFIRTFRPKRKEGEEAYNKESWPKRGRHMEATFCLFSTKRQRDIGRERPRDRE